MSKYPKLFSPLKIAGIELKNRITMTPLYLGMANADGTASDILVDHYREMGSSGAAMVSVENAAVDPIGMGSPTTLRTDSDEFIPGLQRVAKAIKSGGAIAFQQLNHVGRYAFPKEKWGASPMRFGDVNIREMPPDEIRRTVNSFASAALRVKKAGFDGVEIHSGTGYLLVQFLSSRTNRRANEFGGSLENRMRFPLMVFEAVRESVGPDFPVGYRFLADEWLPDGLHLDETRIYARELEKRGVAYLSVMAGTYDSFYLPDYLVAEKKEGYMVRFADGIKKALKNTPVITAGRIQSPATAEEILSTGKADFIGLARVLLADPLWPKKAAGEVTEPINPCEPTCSFCSKRLMAMKPSYCIRWPKPRRETFLSRIGEKAEEAG